jgi:hypothetical protein
VSKPAEGITVLLNPGEPLQVWANLGPAGATAWLERLREAHEVTAVAPALLGIALSVCARHSLPTPGWLASACQLAMSGGAGGAGGRHSRFEREFQQFMHDLFAASALRSAQKHKSRTGERGDVAGIAAGRYGRSDETLRKQAARFYRKMRSPAWRARVAPLIPPQLLDVLTPEAAQDLLGIEPPPPQQPRTQ